MGIDFDRAEPQLGQYAVLEALAKASEIQAKF